MRFKKIKKILRLANKYKNMGKIADRITEMKNT